MKKYKIKSGDLVRVISGVYKSKEGKVLRIDKQTDRVFVEGVAVIKKHQKPTSNNPQGGIIEKEASIHISNVAMVDAKTNKPTRLGYDFVDGKKVRISKSSKEVI